MQSNIQKHRIWHFIDQARMQGKESIEFYRPTGRLADMRYAKLTKELNAMGYKTNDLTSAGTISLVSVLVVSNIQNGDLHG